MQCQGHVPSGGAIGKLDFEWRVWKRTCLKFSAGEAATFLGLVSSCMTAVRKEVARRLLCVCLANSLVDKQTLNETRSGWNN